MKRFEMPESMKLASIWVVWVFLAIGALGWALFMVLDFFEVKEHAAAWVQAVGAIAAIAGAFLIANRQSRQQAQDRRNKDLVVHHLVVDVANRAAGVSHLLFMNFNELQQQVIETSEEILMTVESQVLALRGINPVDLPRSEMVAPFLRIKAAMEQSYVMAGLLAKGRDGYIDRLRCATTFSINSQAVAIAARELQAISLK